MVLLALDEGFPDTIFKVSALLPGIELRRLRDVDSRLVTNSDDWAVLLRLHQHADNFDGLVTVDSRMHEQTKEMAVLHQTNLTLVEFLDTGNDAIKATGLALLWLPYVAQETRPDKPQLWLLRPPPRKTWNRPWEQLGEIASRRGESARATFDQAKLNSRELETDLWEWYEGTPEAY